MKLARRRAAGKAKPNSPGRGGRGRIGGASSWDDDMETEGGSAPSPVHASNEGSTGGDVDKGEVQQTEDSHGGVHVENGAGHDVLTLSSDVIDAELDVSMDPTLLADTSARPHPQASAGLVSQTMIGRSASPGAHHGWKISDSRIVDERQDILALSCDSEDFGDLSDLLPRVDAPIEPSDLHAVVDVPLNDTPQHVEPVATRPKYGGLTNVHDELARALQSMEDNVEAFRRKRGVPAVCDAVSKPDGAKGTNKGDSTASRVPLAEMPQPAPPGMPGALISSFATMKIDSDIHMYRMLDVQRKANLRRREHGACERDSMSDGGRHGSVRSSTADRSSSSSRRKKRKGRVEAVSDSEMDPGASRRREREQRVAAPGTKGRRRVKKKIRLSRKFSASASDVMASELHRSGADSGSGSGDVTWSTGESTLRHGVRTVGFNHAHVPEHLPSYGIAQQDCAVDGVSGGKCRGRRKKRVRYSRKKRKRIVAARKAQWNDVAYGADSGDEAEGITKRIKPVRRKEARRPWSTAPSMRLRVGSCSSVRGMGPRNRFLVNRRLKSARAPETGPARSASDTECLSKSSGSLDCKRVFHDELYSCVVRGYERSTSQSRARTQSALDVMHRRAREEALRPLPMKLGVVPRKIVGSGCDCIGKCRGHAWVNEAETLDARERDVTKRMETWKQRRYYSCQKVRPDLEAASSPPGIYMQSTANRGTGDDKASVLPPSKCAGTANTSDAVKKEERVASKGVSSASVPSRAGIVQPKPSAHGIHEATTAKSCQASIKSALKDEVKPPDRSRRRLDDNRHVAFCRKFAATTRAPPPELKAAISTSSANVRLVTENELEHLIGRTAPTDNAVLSRAMPVSSSLLTDYYLGKRQHVRGGQPRRTRSQPRGRPPHAATRVHRAVRDSSRKAGSRGTSSTGEDGKMWGSSYDGSQVEEESVSYGSSDTDLLPTAQRRHRIAVDVEPPLVAKEGVVGTTMSPGRDGVPHLQLDGLDVGTGMTPKRGTAIGTAITPHRGVSLGTSVTPKRGVAMGTVMTPHQGVAMGTAMTPHEMATLGTAMTPRYGATLGTGMTPRAPRDRWSPRGVYGHDTGTAMTPRYDGVEMGTAMTPRQDGVSMGTTMTPRASRDQLSPRGGRGVEMGTVMTPRRDGVSMGTTMTPRASRDQLSPRGGRGVEMGTVMTPRRDGVSMGTTMTPRASRDQLSPRGGRGVEMGTVMTPRRDGISMGTTMTPQASRDQLSPRGGRGVEMGTVMTPRRDGISMGTTMTPQASRDRLSPRGARGVEMGTVMTPRRDGISMGTTMTPQASRDRLSPRGARGVEMGTVMTPRRDGVSMGTTMTPQASRGRLSPRGARGVEMGTAITPRASRDQLSPRGVHGVDMGLAVSPRHDGISMGTGMSPRSPAVAPHDVLSRGISPIELRIPIAELESVRSTPGSEAARGTPYTRAPAHRVLDAEPNRDHRDGHVADISRVSMRDSDQLLGRWVSGGHHDGHRMTRTSMNRWKGGFVASIAERAKRPLRMSNVLASGVRVPREAALIAATDGADKVAKAVFGVHSEALCAAVAAGGSEALTATAYPGLVASHVPADSTLMSRLVASTSSSSSSDDQRERTLLSMLASKAPAVPKSRVRDHSMAAPFATLMAFPSVPNVTLIGRDASSRIETPHSDGMLPSKNHFGKGHNLSLKDRIAVDMGVEPSNVSGTSLESEDESEEDTDGPSRAVLSRIADDLRMTVPNADNWVSRVFTGSDRPSGMGVSHGGSHKKERPSLASDYSDHDRVEGGLFAKRLTLDGLRDAVHELKASRGQRESNVRQLVHFLSSSSGASD